MDTAGFLNAASYTTVRIPNQGAALSIDSCIHKVEQVSIVWIMAVAACGAEIANRATLHWVSRRGIGSGPGRTAIKRCGDVKMPRRALIIGGLVRVVTGDRRPQ